jgi:ABC-type Fe3+-siderophore transport system permease subunit
MIPFHRFLIGTAILFCLGFAAWEVVAYRTDGAPWELALAIVFAVAGGAFLYYLKNLNRFLHR